MLSKRSVKSECYSSTYARAAAIAKSPWEFSDLRCDYGRYTTVMGFVQSSSGYEDGYDVEVTVDEDDDLVIDYGCTCPAYRKYPGMCKHAAATALLYIDRPEQFAGHRRTRATASSSSISKILAKTASPVAPRGDKRPREAAGTLKLEMTLANSYYEGLAARFKIASPTASYVVQSIEELIRRIDAREYFAYGKKMGFVHSPELFEPQSRRVLSFLKRIIASNRAHVMRRYGIAPRSGARSTSTRWRPSTCSTSTSASRSCSTTATPTPARRPSPKSSTPTRRCP